MDQPETGARHTRDPVPSPTDPALWSEGCVMAEHSNIEWTDAIRDVAAERQRQIYNEGFSPKHDDDHDDGDLAGAAAAYALDAACLLCPYHGTALDDPPDSWPADWALEWWKPAVNVEDARRDLVKAAALILAEIERQDRRVLKGAA